MTKSPLIISISGLRGIIGQSLTPREGAEYGMAFGTFLRQFCDEDDKPRVCIGRDSRPSGSMLAAAVSAGLMATGCEAIDLGIVTTPGAALMTICMPCDGGVVITASHNPVEWNGIKVLGRDGMALPFEQARTLKQIFEDKQFNLKGSLGVAGVSDDNRTHAIHVQSVLKLCDRDLIASRKFKVVLDSINGAGCVVTSQLLSELGCELIHVNNLPTGIFAHTPEPTAENLKELGPLITRHSAAIGFAQD
ncbi:MAG: hypothetical protein JW860_09510, partial [Sedimentisphaerales bacterium]|nr:hypothetical protein [Sedimentisphaerales bacterium]